MKVDCFDDILPVADFEQLKKRAEKLYSKSSSYLKKQPLIISSTSRFPQDYLGYFFRGYGFAWVLVWVATLLAAFHLRFFLATAVAWLSLAPIVFVLHLDQVPFGKGVENRLVLQTFALFLPVVVATVFHLFGLALYKILGDHERLGPMINDWIERLDIKTLR